jgi:hypothetical protein
VCRRLRPLAPDISFFFCLLQHALFSHHDRGASSSPFDPKNVHSSHSHEVISKFVSFFVLRLASIFLCNLEFIAAQVDSISRGKPMTSQGDLPQRPAHPQSGLRRSGEFERGHLQPHRPNTVDHNFAQTYPANPAMNPSSASDSHHIRRPSFDNGRSRDEQVLLLLLLRRRCAVNV